MSDVIAQSRTVATNEAESKTVFGFWLYIMTDCVLFASLFATFAVLRNNTADGPSAQGIFSMPVALTETLVLLTSSFTCGLAMLAAHKRNKSATVAWFAVTFLLGVFFLAMELTEFRHLAHEGNSWRRSGFLSTFFTLVSTHGLHISVGLLWTTVMMIKLLKRGFVDNTLKRLTMLSLFWHFLDIVWIFIFTVVYMIGGAGI